MFEDPSETSPGAAQQHLPAAGHDGLTERQRQVARELARGVSYADVARSLGIAWHTVATHAKAIARKGRLQPRGMVEFIENQTFHEPLSPRERTIAQAIANGTTRQEIAETLGISIHTVRSHVRSVLHKARVRTMRRLAARLRGDDEDTEEGR